MSDGCVIREGERAWVVVGGLIDPSGAFWPTEAGCTIEQGAILSVTVEEVQPMPPDLPEPAPPDSVPGGVRVDDDLPISEPASPPPAPAPHIEAPASSLGDAAPEAALAIDAAKVLGDNPWAPLVMVVLAVVAVVGGRQGWKFYSERSARSHELEMRRLELANAPGVQPPPCQARDAEHDARFAALEQRVAKIEQKSASLPDWDEDALEELEKRLKKLERKPAAKPKGTA